MPKAFDATFKDLVATFPGDFGTAFDLARPVPFYVENVELSVVSAATDVILGRGQPPDAFIILDFQASGRAGPKICSRGRFRDATHSS